MPVLPIVETVQFHVGTSVPGWTSSTSTRGLPFLSKYSRPPEPLREMARLWGPAVPTYCYRSPGRRAACVIGEQKGWLCLSPIGCDLEGTYTIAGGIGNDVAVYMSASDGRVVQAVHPIRASGSRSAPDQPDSCRVPSPSVKLAPHRHHSTRRVRGHNDRAAFEGTARLRAFH